MLMGTALVFVLTVNRWIFSFTRRQGRDLFSLLLLDVHDARDIVT